jgi:hypothetical protein
LKEKKGWDEGGLVAHGARINTKTAIFGTSGGLFQVEMTTLERKTTSFLF